jgi:hypothetical protein
MNERIYTKVIETHQLLDEYIAIHDELIASPKGLVGILKKIFKPINFSSYVQGLSTITKSLTENLSGLEVLDNHSLQDNELQLKQILSRFIIDLRKTVDKLSEINQKLAQKADGKTYSMSEYNKDMKEYQDLVDSYTATGSQLNRIFREQD